MNPSQTKYVIITPARDEEEHLEQTILAVASQTVRPAQWIIVNDGSRDGTGALIDRYASLYPWITARHRANRGYREAGGGVIRTFYDGYAALTSPDWEFLVKLDADLSFSSDYFERCFAEFAGDPRLGIGGGGIYHEVNGTLKLEENPRFHVRGATKIYRRACWDGLGGLLQAPGWDTSTSSRPTCSAGRRAASSTFPSRTFASPAQPTAHGTTASRTAAPTTSPAITRCSCCSSACAASLANPTSADRSA